MRSLRIRFVGRQDRNGDDYYFTTTAVPALIDLSNSVLHFYPDEEENGKDFGGELVVRPYEPNKEDFREENRSRVRRKRRRSNASTEPSNGSDSDSTES
jgi:hypothetical protein